MFADIKQMGWGGWLTYSVDRTLCRISLGRVRLHVLKFYLQPVPTKRIVAVRPTDPVRVGPITRDAIDHLAFRRPLEAINDRFEDGSICIAATRDSTLLGFMWLQQGTLRERIVHCQMHAEPRQRVAWDYDFFIEPSYRLSRLFGRLWDASADHLRASGIEATVSWIRLENRASAHAHARLGARQIGWAAFLVAFDRQLMLGSIHPRFAYSGIGHHIDLSVDVSSHLDHIRPGWSS